MHDWMNDPELSQLPPMTTPTSDLKGLAQRESAIPSHYAMSLSDLRAQRTAPTAPTTQPSQPRQPSQPQRAPLIEPHEIAELTEQGALIFQQVAKLVRRVAESGDSVDHSALEGLALRLETLQPKSAPTRAEQRNKRAKALELARSLRAEGKMWEEVASTLNAKGLRGKRGQKWRGASIRQATLRDEADKAASDED